MNLDARMPRPEGTKLEHLPSRHAEHLAPSGHVRATIYPSNRESKVNFRLPTTWIDFAARWAGLTM